MKHDSYYITNLHKNNNGYTAYEMVKVYGVDPDLGTYERYERERGTLSELLRNLRGDNKFNIRISDKKRKGDRNYTARYYQIPYSFILAPCDYEDAREIGLNNPDFSIYRQEDGQGCMMISAGGTVIIERLYVIKHEVADGTMPFYYDKKGRPCSQLSLNYGMFFSSSKQAMDKQAHIYDKCTHIETIFIDPRLDPNNLCD